eukprot:734518-Rhodomonas_salina.1
MAMIIPTLTTWDMRRTSRIPHNREVVELFAKKHTDWINTGARAVVLMLQKEQESIGNANICHMIVRPKRIW